MIGPGCFWFGNMWIFPIICILIMLLIFFICRHRGISFPCCSNNNDHKKNSNETALDILKKRYAKGEISKEEFQQIKKDISET
jgi:putative membrane protein